MKSFGNYDVILFQNNNSMSNVNCQYKIYEYQNKMKNNFTMKNVSRSVLLILRCWQHQIPSQVTQHSSVMFFQVENCKEIQKHCKQL